MWVWSHCFATLNAPCNPRTWGQLGQMIAAFMLALVLIVAFWIALMLLGEWLGDLFTSRR